ncbi:tetratricopeptide repeat-containing sulfotransferase family protein [Phenylobacterium sp.]|uniref:tetratricopeptide repeat-containing sulfotransferase family protein n=1 Tax=Phenylobacterium sp. TaxID=1871053 RepID=UPI002F920E52
MTQPPSFETAVAQARAALLQGRLDDARRAIKTAAAAQPKSPQPWLMRADVARAAGDIDDFQKSLGKARGLIADPALGLRLDVDRASALLELGRRAKALELARAAADVIEAEPRLSGRLAALLDALEAPEAAAPLAERAAALEPGRPEVWLDLAIVRRALGELDAAEAACERAIALRPGFTEAHAVLTTLKRWTSEANHVERLRAALAGAAPRLERARLGYALFKELDDLERRDEAWAALQAAADEARRVYPWADAADAELVTALQRAFPEPPTSSPAKPRVPRPIFVVGLPRSGTSLVERILSAHSRVSALGELGTFGALVAGQLGAAPQTYVDADVASRLDRVDWRAVGEGYREIVQRLAPGAAVTVDKLPQNWLYAGAIARALPDAVIVHLDRGAMDNLFGCYRQLFQRDFHWSYSLDDLAAHYAHYRRLTDHWRSVLGHSWADVDYEALARDPEPHIRRLLDACGLPFEAACLRPHEAAGRARSISMVQLQQPINTRGIGAWRAYAERLEPLRAQLESMGLLQA